MKREEGDVKSEIINAAGSQVFDFKGNKVRTAGTWERPLFCAADVCVVLSIADVADACGRLDPEDVEEVPQKTHNPGSSGIGRPALYVTESGLYQLILGSRKHQARPFKRWVTGEVLPTIRKLGYYSLFEAQLAEERKKLLASHFTELPGPAVPLFSDLIDALLRRFGWRPTKTPRTKRESASAPPWARQLAQWVYEWAIRVDGQQQFRRCKNPAPPSGSPKYPDHSMFAGATKDAVREVCRTGVAIVASSASWEDWKLRMELAYGTKQLQVPLMVPMLTARNDSERAPA